MRHLIDAELRGHAMIFQGPLDLVTSARDALAKGRSNPYHEVKPPRVSWPGRQGKTWDELVQFLHKPWPEGVSLIKRVVELIRESGLPAPKSVKRKPRWSEIDGDVDVDLALQGEPAMFRETHRRRVHSPTQISLLANLDLSTAYRCNPSGVFFRSAACIALADILENAGYTVEIWIWCLGWNVYPKPNHKQFTACRVKAMGDPVDYDALVDALSAWFTTVAIRGSMSANPADEPISRGDALEAPFDLKGTMEAIGKWRWHIDLGPDVQVAVVPMVMGWLGDGGESGVRNAAKTAKAVLDDIVRREGADRVGDSPD